MEILSEHSVFSREAREERGEPTDLGTLFLWGAVILALLGLNAFSWIFCMYVFGNPEVPFNYKLLTHPKIDRLDPIRGFEPVTAPRGNFQGARKLYTEVYDYTPEQINAYNGILKRHYLHNYKERDDVPYLSGNFRIESVRELQPEDVFPSGLAIRAVAEDLPAAYLDLVLPSEKVPAGHYKPGENLVVEESATCAALLHVQPLGEDKICFTVVPLVMREFKTPSGETIATKPPERLNLETGHWPISHAASLDDEPKSADEEKGAEAEPAKGKDDSGAP